MSASALHYGIASERALHTIRSDESLDQRERGGTFSSVEHMGSGRSPRRDEIKQYMRKIHSKDWAERQEAVNAVSLLS